MLIGFIIITVLGIALGAAGIITLEVTKNATFEISELQATSKGAFGVLNAHYTWRHSLTEAVLTHGKFSGSLDPNSCALSKWLAEDEMLIKDHVVLDLLKQIENPHRFIHTEARAIVNHLEAGDYEAAETCLTEIILPRTQEVISLLMGIEDRFAELIAGKNQEILDLKNTTIFILIGVIIAVAVLSVFLTIYISSIISKPIKSLTAYLDKAGSQGDLSFTDEENTVMSKIARQQDELGQLTNSAMVFVNEIAGVSDVLEAISSGDITQDAHILSEKDTMGMSLQHMLDNLNSMFNEIHASTNQVSTGSRQVAEGAQSLAQGSTEQAAAIDILSSSISEILERVRENAETADKTARLSDSIKNYAEKGSAQMDDMISAVGDINEASRNISKIIKTIDDIAFQTNILALNAAVEAARAGQHGKGFAVVAEEVRNLASKSAEAAKDTGIMIQNSMEKAELGSRIAGETAASLNDIVVGINESSQLIAEIARASEQQSIGIGQINNGIDQVAQVVQQNSATAQESAAASEEMSGQSDMLQQLISQFKIKDGGRSYMDIPESANASRRRIGTDRKAG